MSADTDELTRCHRLGLPNPAAYWARNPPVVLEDKRLDVPRHCGAIEITVDFLNADFSRPGKELFAPFVITCASLLVAATPKPVL